AAPAAVKERASHAFELLTRAEAAIHGTTVEKVHLHEVGAVDAILDVVGTVWGLDLLGVEHVCCGTIVLGDGYVDAAHGRMAVPAPAVARLIEGFDVAPGPPQSGELTTPTGAALLQALARPGLPRSYRPHQSGYGAGTKDPAGRANVLRVTLADVEDEAQMSREPVVLIACDVDDMSGEYLAAAATAVKAAGALDVTLIPVVMKKGRPGTRIEALCREASVPTVERALLAHTSTLGVRHTIAGRTTLPRRTVSVTVGGHEVAIKIATLPDGSTRIKPEFDDVARVAAATGRSAEAIHDEALRMARDS
ncbi:MAG TPA: LarC family nickel insertion protein, partial [Gemmatimonadaceae bacterium]|nr:LarC family nickel insertion protein [Gemmatimonadaceae bacterium]